jgi:hypothetical protein
VHVAEQEAARGEALERRAELASEGAGRAAEAVDDAGAIGVRLEAAEAPHAGVAERAVGRFVYLAADDPGVVKVTSLGARDRRFPAFGGLFGTAIGLSSLSQAAPVVCRTGAQPSRFIGVTMRSSSILVAVSSLFLFACGSGGSDPSSQKGTSSAQSGAFNPPAVAEGYTRLVPTDVPTVAPGDDVTYCQYVMAPLDHDVDVLDVMGYEGKGGHHAIAFTYKPDAGEEPGLSFPCMGSEFNVAAGDQTAAAQAAAKTSGTFLGGVTGQNGDKSVQLPPGVAYRLNKGNGVMLNVHFINTGTERLPGDAVVDIKMVDVDPNRTIAALFTNVNMGFEVPPSAPGTSTIDCVAKSDLHIFMMSNHMHDYGTSATTEVVRADGTVEELHKDAKWTTDMQFNAVYSNWPIDAPFLLKAGDTVRTTCNWNNPTATSLQFPREMCVGVGFTLTTGDNPSAPMCISGQWIEGGI